MRATVQKSTQQPGETSASSTGQSFDGCWLDHWDAYWQNVQQLERATATAGRMLVIVLRKGAHAHCHRTAEQVGH